MLKRLYEKIIPTGVAKLFSTDETRKEAEEAHLRAQSFYEEAQSRKTEVTEVATQLRLQRERNQFAYLIEKTMKGNG